MIRDPLIIKAGNNERPPLCKRGDRGDFMDTSAIERQIDEYIIMPNHIYGIIIVGAGLVPALI